MKSTASRSTCASESGLILLDKSGEHGTIDNITITVKTFVRKG